MYDIEILLDYCVETIAAQLQKNNKMFYIITNTKSMNEEQTVEVINQVLTNINEARSIIKYPNILQLVSRCDSALRGHFPAGKLNRNKVLANVVYIVFKSTLNIVYIFIYLHFFKKHIYIYILIYLYIYRNRCD